MDTIHLRLRACRDLSAVSGAALEIARAVNQVAMAHTDAELRYATTGLWAARGRLAEAVLALDRHLDTVTVTPVSE